MTAHPSRRLGEIHVHHVRSKGSGGDDREDNLISLCWLCHDALHRGRIPRDQIEALVNTRRALRQLGLAVCECGWTVVAPSSIPFDEGDPVPTSLDEAGTDGVVAAFETATQPALAAGFRVIEIHAAHGYLLHAFLSPLSNHRTDAYGGNLENRMRLLLRVAERLRSLMPNELPLFVRISGTDWVEGGWDIEQSVVLSQRLKERGVDLIDVSSGGLVPRARIPVSKGYQVPLARRIREEAQIMTGTVGMITEPHHADEIITGGDADLVLLAREMLREPYWALKAQHELGEEPVWPIQYGYAVKRRAK